MAPSGSKLSLRQTSRLALAPSIRTGLGLLRMPALELDELVRREAEENPFLVVSDPIARRSGIGAHEQIDTLVARKTLAELVREQLVQSALPAQVCEVASFLAADLTDEGYLDTDTDAIEELLAVPEETVNAAIAALQACDPPGIGARSMSECLVIQLRRLGTSPGHADAAIGHLSLLAKGRLDEVSRRAGIDLATVSRIHALLPKLQPRPVLPDEDLVRVRVPEIVVERHEADRLVARLNTDVLSRIRFDRKLFDTIATAGGPSGEMTTKADRARTLDRAVQFRGRTLLRVAQILVDRQADFFLCGREAMAPLSRNDIATRLKLHPSTIGRAVADKTLEYEGAIFLLADMLKSSSFDGPEGTEISSIAVQHRIRRMIAAERRGAPLSDDVLAAALRREGIDIARRTVAKYRQCMDIPSSFVRRRKAALPVRRPTGSVRRKPTDF